LRLAGCLPQGVADRAAAPDEPFPVRRCRARPHPHRPDRKPSRQDWEYLGWDGVQVWDIFLEGSAMFNRLEGILGLFRNVEVRHLLIRGVPTTFRGVAGRRDRTEAGCRAKRGSR
jgi:hypothetical protein